MTIICWDHLLRLSLDSEFWDYLFRSCVEMFWWDQLTRSAVEIICWDQLLRSAVNCRTDEGILWKRNNWCWTDFLLEHTSFFSKHTKKKSSAGARGNVAIWATRVEEERLPITPSRSFASPARTYGTNTIRNRNKFPGWELLADSSPQPPIQNENPFCHKCRRGPSPQKDKMFVLVSCYFKQFLEWYVFLAFGV